MVSLDRPIMPNEERTKLERIISAAIRDTRRQHPGMDMVELTSSIIKRLIPNLLNAFYVLPRLELEEPEDPAVLRDELVRLRRNAEQNERDAARLMKKKVRQDKRMRIMVETMRGMAAQGNEAAQSALNDVALID